MKRVLFLMLIAATTGCVTPVAAPALDPGRFERSDNVWQPLGAGARAEGPVAPGQFYASVGQLVGALALTGDTLDVSVDRQYQRLRINVVTTGLPNAQASEKYEIDARVADGGLTVIGVRKLVLADAQSGTWTAAVEN